MARARLDSLIADGMTQTGVPGTAVAAVVHDDTVVYERVIGVRELGNWERWESGSGKRLQENS